MVARRVGMACSTGVRSNTELGRGSSQPWASPDAPRAGWNLKIRPNEGDGDRTRNLRIDNPML